MKIEGKNCQCCFINSQRKQQNKKKHTGINGGVDERSVLPLQRNPNSAPLHEISGIRLIFLSNTQIKLVILRVHTSTTKQNGIDETSTKEGILRQLQQSRISAQVGSSQDLAVPIRRPSARVFLELMYTGQSITHRFLSGRFNPSIFLSQNRKNKKGKIYKFRLAKVVIADYNS